MSDLPLSQSHCVHGNWLRHHTIGTGARGGVHLPKVPRGLQAEGQRRHADLLHVCPIPRGVTTLPFRQVGSYLSRKDTSYPLPAGTTALATATPPPSAIPSLCAHPLHILTFCSFPLLSLSLSLSLSLISPHLFPSSRALVGQDLGAQTHWTRHSIAWLPSTRPWTRSRSFTIYNAVRPLI